MVKHSSYPEFCFPSAAPELKAIACLVTNRDILGALHKTPLAPESWEGKELGERWAGDRPHWQWEELSLNQRGVGVGAQGGKFEKEQSLEWSEAFCAVESSLQKLRSLPLL